MRPRWASAVAAVGMAMSGMLFFVVGSPAGAALALAVAGVFAAQARRTR